MIRYGLHGTINRTKELYMMCIIWRKRRNVSMGGGAYICVRVCVRLYA